MFQWTTTTILNSLEDFTAKDDEGKALPLVTVDAKGNLRIKRDHTFEPRWVRNIYKAEGKDAELFSLDVDFTDVVTTFKEYLTASGEKVQPGRLAFYIALEGSEEHIYANDWYQKGKPFTIGFQVKANTTAADVVNEIVKNDKAHGVAMYGKKLFELKADGATLKISGTHEYQRLYLCGILVDEGIDEIAEFSYEDGRDSDAIFTLNKRGSNGFGTYSQLVKDLRLPTVHHNKWLQIKADETPVVGAKYNQYIINYCAPSMANPGFTVVGQHNMSVTTHIFWVNQAIADEFEGKLGEAGLTFDEVSYPDYAGIDTPKVDETGNKVSHLEEIDDVKA